MDKVRHRLAELGFSDNVIECYGEKHRHYHNENHLRDVLSYLSLKGEVSDELFLAAVYHDAVYDPRSDKNEWLSAEMFLVDAAGTNLSSEQKEKIKRYILDTREHDPSDAVSASLIEADLSILNQPFSRLMQYEYEIFKEFQFVDYSIYKSRRLEVLKRMNEGGKLNHLIEFVEYRTPAIGVFCGSFNPFHKGHFNVLQKAERIFDKVIVAFGKNPDKNVRTWPVPRSLDFHQKEEYSGLLTDFLDTLKYNVVVIRGLRNSTDFQYEQNQYRYIQELKPGVKIINIFCDKEFEHISSSGIRTLEKFDKHHRYLLD